MKNAARGEIVTHYQELVEQAVDESADWRQRHVAFTGLVRQFQDMAYAYALGRLGDTHLAEDAAQESFVTVWQQLPKLRDTMTFPLWLKRIVSTHCHRVTRRAVVDTVPLDAVIDIAGGENPSAMFERAEMRREVQREIARLRENERVAVTLFYMGDYGYSDLADFLGVPLSTVKKRLYSARRRLRERMITTMLTDAIQENKPSGGDEFVRRIELFTAINAGDVDTVRRILADMPQLAESTMTEGFGITAQRAITTAVVAGYFDIVEALINAGAKLTEADVREASLRGQRDLARQLVDIGGVDEALAELPADAAALFKAIHSGDLNDIDRLIDHAGINTAGSLGRTALMVASANGFVDVVQKLLDKGADVNLVDRDGLDAVHIAVKHANWCWKGHAEVVEILVGGGAKCDIWSAARGGVVSVVKKMVDADPSLVNAEDGSGETALECAVGSFTSGAGDIIGYLRERNPTMNFWMACQFSDIDAVRRLLDESPSLATAPRSETRDRRPIHYTAQNWGPQENAAQIVDLLADHGADVDGYSGGWTPLHACAEWWNDTLIAGALLRHGANVNARSAQGWTPLRYAVALGRNEMATFLREHGGEE